MCLWPRMLLSLSCLPPVKAKSLYLCFHAYSSHLFLVNIPPPKLVAFQLFIVISCGSLCWLVSAGHFSLGSLLQLKSDVGWSYSHRRSWLSKISKMAPMVAGSQMELSWVWAEHLLVALPYGLGFCSPTPDSEREHAKRKYSKRQQVEATKSVKGCAQEWQCPVYYILPVRAVTGPTRCSE